MTVEYDPAVHYDKVTAAWLLLLGEELHYGMFEPGDDLTTATGRLTDHMVAGARFGDVDTPLRVLDVGCGTGAPAVELGQRFGADVLGITTSEVGVRTATRRAEAAGVRGVAFEQRDGMDNGLPDASFDVVWALESSHLMRDRDAVLDECTRVLRPGGRVVLCDLLRHREIPFEEVRERRADFTTLREAFGDAHFETLAFHSEGLAARGLEVEVADDLTTATLPTFEAWRANAATHRDEVVDLIGTDGLEVFVRSCDILEGFWRDGTFGYGLVAAKKP